MISIAMSLVLVASFPPRPRPVVVSTDCGAEIDDQWALAHLALSPEIDLKGVVTTHAPGLDPKRAATVAAEVFREVGRREPPPILPGSALPMGPAGAPRDNPGVRFLIDEARKTPEGTRLAVVMIGAATDVASALQIDPTFADRVIVVAMAFEGWADGGDPWNVKNDVTAWQVVMRSGTPLVVGDATVTRHKLARTPASARESIGDREPGGPYLCGLLERWIAREPKLAETASGRPGTWIVWDEVAVAYLLGMTSQEERPRPKLKDDRTFDHIASEGAITWITDIDGDRLWADLAAKLSPERAAGAKPRGAAFGTP